MKCLQPVEHLNEVGPTRLLGNLASLARTSVCDLLKQITSINIEPGVEVSLVDIVLVQVTLCDVPQYGAFQF